MRKYKVLATGVLLAAALLLQGCLDADRMTALSYDAKTDSFTLLRIFYNIHGTDQADVANLIALYANRDHILPAEAWPMLGESAVIRVDGGVREVDLGKASMAAITTPPVDVSSLQNKPGMFFTTSDGLLGYYHQILIPGAAMDKMVAWAQTQAQTGIAKSAADEMQTRKAGAAKQSWAHERRILQDGIRALPEEKREKQMDGETMFLSAMEDASLASLADATQKATFTLTRKNGVFHAALKLTPADAGEIKATITALRSELQNKIESGADPAKESDMALATLVDALDINVAADGTVDAAADIDKVGPLIAKLQAAGIKPPDAEKKDDYARILAGVKDSKIQLQGPMTAAAVIEKFMKGDLKVNASEKPVKVGQGLTEDGK